MEYKALGEYCTITSSKRIFADQYVEEGIPFYRSKEIIEKNHGDRISAPLFIDEAVYNNIKSKFGVPESGDMLLTSVGTLGIPYIVKNERFYFKDGNLTWMKDFSKELSTHYLYYWITSDFGYKSLTARCIGSSQAALTIDILKKYKLLIPDRKTQDGIVKILSKYDSLIEANNKRIKVLEQMAENLYKEWFVRFRFPGYETAEFENGLPKGWKYNNFSDVYSFDRGVSYSSEEIECDDGENLINLKNIQGYGGFRRDGTKKYSGQYKNDQVVHYLDLVMGVTDMTQDRRTVGSVALIPDMVGVISADLIKLASSIDNIFSYCLFRYGFYSAYISQFGNGANVIHLKPSSIKNIKILLPSEELIAKFVSVVKPLIEQIEKLNTKNDNLIKQRDLLLPRLMSGKLEV